MKRIGTSLLLFAAMGVATGLVLEHRARTRFDEENRILRERAAQLGETDPKRGSQPSLVQVSPSAPTGEMRELLRLRGEVGVLHREREEADRLRTENDRMRSNWVEQVLEGKKLSPEQVAGFLAKNQRNAESLLAAARVTGDPALLQEAIEKFPQDPRVAFAACFALSDGATPQERRQRRDAFKQAAPDNALANYLSAQEHFKSGELDAAVRELLAATGKARIEDYSAEFTASAAEAYRSAGLTPVEASWAASGQPLPQLAALKGVSQGIGDLAKRYQETGDAASAQVALEMSATLGRRLDEPAEPTSLIQQLVGIAIERTALAAMDPTSPYGTAGLTVKDRLDELTQLRASIKEVAGDDASWRTLSEADQAAFFEKMRSSGELEALRWARTRQVQR